MNFGETDLQNAMSQPVTGKLDSELTALVPHLEDRQYTNLARLYYATTSAPDATFSMSWSSWSRSKVNQIGDFSRLTPPPQYIWEGHDYEWPSVSPGTETWWGELADGSRTNQVLDTAVDRPPSVKFPIPWEHCAQGTFTNAAGDTYSRGAHTDVRLHSGDGYWPKPTRSVLLSVLAADKSDGSTVPWAVHEYFLAEPSTTWSTTEVDPASRLIQVCGHTVDANGYVLVDVPVRQNVSVTPVLPDCSWYGFQLVLTQHMQVRMSWSRHPQASALSPQGKFDDGAQLLAQDDDQRIKNPTDPNDDVPLYVEFFIIPALAQIFPGKYATNSDYNVIVSQSLAEELLGQTFSNVKLVTYMGWETNGTFVEAWGLSVTNSPTIILRADAPAATAVHEWGHTAGCPDRNSNPTAIMCQDYVTNQTTRCEINTTELGVMCGWNQRWVQPFWQ